MLSMHQIWSTSTVNIDNALIVYSRIAKHKATKQIHLLTLNWCNETGGFEEVDISHEANPWHVSKTTIQRTKSLANKHCKLCSCKFHSLYSICSKVVPT